jgi:plasmid maintenance system antidote protein VapI
MKKYEKIYKELRKKYTDEEIADSMLIPADLTEEERKKADEEIREFRFRLLRERTEEQRIFSDLMRLRFQLENYIKEEKYSEDKSFGRQLEEYARILKRTKKELSEDLDIHYTRLSRIINGKEEPNIELAYRLEQHSGKLISAIIWWRLIIKKQEYEIRQDKETRDKEASRVKNAVKIRA